MLPFFLLTPLCFLVTLNTFCKQLNPEFYHHLSFTFYSSFLLTPHFVKHLTHRLMSPFDEQNVYDEVSLIVTYVVLSFVYTTIYCRKRPNPTTLALYILVLAHELTLGVQNTPIHRFVLILCAFGNFKHYLNWIQIYKPNIATHGWNLLTWSTWFSCILSLLTDFSIRQHSLYNLLLITSLPWMVPLDQEMTINHLEYGPSPLLITAPVEIFKDFVPSSHRIHDAVPQAEEIEQDLIQFD